MRCLDPTCLAPATADEPTVHESTAGPVLVWRVTCERGHTYTDHTTTADADW